LQNSKTDDMIDIDIYTHRTDINRI